MQSWAEVLQKSELFVYLHSRCAWKLVPNAPRAGEGPFFGLSSGCVKGSGEEKVVSAGIPMNRGFRKRLKKRNLLIITSDTQIQSDNASDLSKGLSLNIVIKQLLQSYFREFNSVMLHILTSFSF